MIKKVRAARGKRATNKDPAPTTPEPLWTTEPEPTAYQDQLKAEQEDRRHRLDDLYRLMNGVR